ncbi:MAG: PEP-CTERM sorting domain-containing protein [Anaerolineae bacterium]|nr:PEP-CTERM sorting domain-containing protein [Phycisphaerae bacterium]
MRPAVRTLFARVAAITLAAAPFGFAGEPLASPSGTNLTWVGNSGVSNHWIRSFNWSNSGFYPHGPGSSATINDNDASIDGMNINVDHLSFSNAILTGNGTLTANQSMTINSTESSNNFLQMAALRNLGTANFASGGVLASQHMLIDNVGTMNVTKNVLLTFFFAPPPVFQNPGLLQKTGGGGTANFDAFIHNTGTIRANDGTLQLGTFEQDSFSNSGTFISDAGSLRMKNLTFGSGANFRGTGTNYLDEGNIIGAGVTIASGARLLVGGAGNNIGGTLTINSGGTLELGFMGTEGSINGNGRIQGPGTFAWTQGTIKGALGPGGSDLTTTAPMHITGPGAKTLAEGRFTNAGSAVWDEGNITTNFAAVFSNSGTMDLRSDNFLAPFFAGPATLVNTGTWKKTAGGGNSQINIDLQNTGTVLAGSGTLNMTGFSAASSSSGTFVSNGSGVVQLHGQTLTTGANFGGTGTSELGGTNTVAGAVGVNAGSALRVVGPDNAIIGTLSLASGAVLELTATNTSGELQGNGRIQGAGQFKWTAGTITGAIGAGSDSLTVTAPMLITSPGGKTLTEGRFTTAGSAVWDDGDITTNFTATLTNAGTMDLRSDNNLAFFFAGPAILRNTGLWMKTASAGTSTMSIDLQNTGTLLASSGTLTFKGLSAASTSSGTIVSNGSGVVRMEGQSLASGTTFRGTGTSELAQSNNIPAIVNIANGAALRVASLNNTLAGTIAIASGGTLNLASFGEIEGAGRIDGPGNFVLAGTLSGPTSRDVSALTINAPTRISTGATFAGGRILNQADIIWDGGGITTNVGPQITNAGTIDLRSDDSLGMFFGPVAQILNTGQFKKTAGTGNSNIQAAFTNTGEVRLNSGTVNFADDFVSTGTLTVSPGAGVSFSGANTTIGGAQHWPAGFVLSASGNSTFLTDAGANGANLSVFQTGTTNFAVTQHLAGLAVLGHVTVSPGGNRILSTGTISFGVFPKLDLTDNDMIVASTTYDTITTQIRSARNGGLWDGNGITSSAAAAAFPKNRTLGTLTGQEYRSVNGPSATFDGEPVANTDTLVKYTYYGDTDFNGVVDFDDYARTDGGFNNNRTGWFNGDFDYNGIVDFDDYSLIDGAFNTQSGTLRRAMSYLDGTDRSNQEMNGAALGLVREHFAQFGNAYASSFLNSIPEPTSALALSGLAASAASRRRRRR